MLSVCSPLQLEPTSSFPFHTEMRSGLHSSSSPQYQHQQHQQQLLHQSSSPRPSTDWNPTPPTSNSSAVSAYSGSNKDCRQQPESMIPTQSHQMYSSTFYPPTDYNSSKTMPPQISPQSQYMPSGLASHRPSIHDRRQSTMAGHHKSSANSASMSDPRPTSGDNAHASPSVDPSHVPAGTWDSTQAASLQDAQARTVAPYSTMAPNLPPLSEALHGISPDPSHTMAISPPMQAPPTMMSSIGDSVTSASPSNFYASNPYMDVPASSVQVYGVQDQFAPSQESLKMPQSHPTRHPSPPHTMMTSATGIQASPGYGRRVTYPFVPAVETGTGLMMGMVPAEGSGSSPMNSGAFTHGGLVGANATPVPNMSRSSPIVGYMDSLSLHQQASPHAHSGHGMPPNMHSMPWPQDDLGGGEGSHSKIYSFVPLSGVNSKKRPRRRFDEIERLYVCNWADCEKSYGTLNHLNAHVNMQKHGPKRLPAEFKELRKAWRRHKRAEEEAAKQAAAFHHQQGQGQVQVQAQGLGLSAPHGQTPLQLCDPVLTHMHPHSLTMHSMPPQHHQPQHLPHPHAHPNQHPHHHVPSHPHHALSQSQHHQHHPMGF